MVKVLKQYVQFLDVRYSVVEGFRFFFFFSLTTNEFTLTFSSTSYRLSFFTTLHYNTHPSLLPFRVQWVLNARTVSKNSLVFYVTFRLPL